MIPHVPQLRIFVASPGDVNQERAVVLQVLDMLEYDPLFRTTGGVSLKAIAWDAPGGDTPQLATKTPQTAIREGLPAPSECDIVLVLFWSRMGTPLPYPEYQKADGAPYLSGSEWEFWDAVNAERIAHQPITLIYRRTEKPVIDLDDDAALAQYKAVHQFFAQFRDPASGALLAGVNEYATPDDLRIKLLTHLRLVIDRLLHQKFQPGQATPIDRPLVEAKPAWPGSPFPGLRAFNEQDAPIFFGRGLEISDLVKRLETSRFVGIVAASGSGKSSLVRAGVIPCLKADAIANTATSSRSWRYVSFKPGAADSPFAALFDSLCAVFPEHAVPPSALTRELTAFVEGCQADGGVLISLSDALMAEADAPAWAEIVIFIDQFEELFTVVKAADRAPFITLLETIQASKRLRCIAAVRSDFYANCAELPALAALFNAGVYTLAAPTAGALVEMIKRPAERARLTWEDGLPEHIQADTGSAAGALALMAYALDELYKSASQYADSRLTFEAYLALGGVSGAIGKRAESVFAQLALPDKSRLLAHVFRELIVVDERGTATRRRAPIDQFDADELALIRAFIDARLLVIDENWLEVAHEAVFRSWDRLAKWIVAAQDDLILLRQLRTAAEEWDWNAQPDYLRWPAERLNPIAAMLIRQQPALTAIERDFIEPEQTRLLRELSVPETRHERRRDIGDRLAVIGDPRPGLGVIDGTPDFVWLPVDTAPEPVRMKLGGTEIGPLTIAPFFIGQYLVTYAQYQAFSDADDGFQAERWWLGMPDAYQQQTLAQQRTKTANSPRDNVSWYQSVAFARWVNVRLHGLELTHRPSGKTFLIGQNALVRLPMEWEWQWAAQRGAKKFKYPWGDWQTNCANTSEAGPEPHDCRRPVSAGQGGVWRFRYGRQRF